MPNTPSPSLRARAFAEAAPEPNGPRRTLPKDGNGDGARDRVVNDIISGLYEGRYTPGERLVEARLTAAYRISRGPVREALNHLAAMGIVSLVSQQGARVRKLSVRDAIDILEVVQGLFGVAARIAAGRIRAPGAAEKVRAAFAGVDAFDPTSSRPDYAAARDHFYAVLTEVAANSELLRILPSVQLHLVRVQFSASARAVDEARHADYRRIADAVLNGRPGAAEAAVRTHFARAIKALGRTGPRRPERAQPGPA